MGQLSSLDLKGLMEKTISEVFDTMFSIEVETVTVNPETITFGNQIVGSVSFAGEAVGSVRIHVSEVFGQLMTADMLGMEADEIESEEIGDVIGELSNMVGGDIKSRLCDAGLPCELSIPSITSGSDFEIQSRNWSRHEHVAIQHDNHIAIVEVYVK